MKPTSAHTFSDAKVVSWKLSDDLLEVEVSDVVFGGESHGPAKLAFPLIKPAAAMSFDFGSNEWIDEPKVEPLREIGEFYFKREVIYSLKGFGAESGKFLAIAVLSREASIEW